MATRLTGFTGHPKGETKTGLAVGMDSGHVLTKRELKPKPSYRKGKLNKRVAFVREIVREVAGYAPYEKRTMELLKVGKEKRALKVLKSKLGTHKRAKSKREEMSAALRAQRMK
uniref:60S ribosomal protein L36 n=1 Tax=Chrysotila carterae TaxID=13221 RepID=A0A6S9SL99_CHRCT|mmetsp:Transcript_45160/g.98198  ORF Transcript_45160/g.98198 Transcript_45160/m.98198 type:complete len:114 (-) Transcript_45160:213-554(-)